MTLWKRHFDPSRMFVVATLALITFAACSSDSSTTPDAATNVDGGGVDGASVGDTLASEAGAAGDDALSSFDCTGKPDGTICAEASICLANVCEVSSCGDGYVNAAAGETCEDGNQEGGDGCTQCAFDCNADVECSDGNVCTGVETCDKSVASKATCKAGTLAANTTACTLAGGGTGACSSGACVSMGCGNNTVDQGEECDDGNAADDDGCTRECKFTCKTNMDCNDGNACTGTETCNVTLHTCTMGTAVTCAAAGCAMPGTCDPMTGMCAYADVDGDGKTCDVDCKDNDPAVFPGAFECADGKDNDCNAATNDVGAPSCECYVDSDGDGFALNQMGAITSAGTCPKNYTRTKPLDQTTIDCGPKFPSAKPGQTQFFPTAYCPLNFGLCKVGASSFDYNCDKVEAKLYNTIAAATCAGALSRNCSNRSGWVGANPACGAKGTYRQCTFVLKVGCVGKDTAGTVQSCR